MSLHPWDVRRRMADPGGWRIVCLDRVGSTNDVARRAGDGGAPGRLAVFAELQTAGRGRLGRRWEAPLGRGLTGSTLWRPEVPAARLGTLAQVAGLAAVRALGACGVAAELKWPNDVLLGGAKCGGILIESSLEGSRAAYAVIGIGLNVLQTAGELPPTPYPATSVYERTGRALDRAVLAAELLGALSQGYERWLTDAAETFHGWRAMLGVLGRFVTVVGPGREVSGLARDVEPDGALVVERGDGAVERFISGEVSLRG